jgi:hypothetical protein
MPTFPLMTVSLALDDFAFEALREDDGGPPAADISLQLECAIRTYLLDRDEPSPGWKLADLELGPTKATSPDHQVEVDPTLWDSLGEEAARQGVEPLRLLNHAALYYAALADSGALTERMLGDIQTADS